MTNKAPILIMAIGNPGRGDDAFGPMLADQLLAWLDTQTDEIQDCIELICDQQLMVEHVMDLADRQQVLFADAAAQGSEPVSLAVLVPLETDQAVHAVNSHSCTPPQLLGLYQAMLMRAPPPSQLLSLTGHSFELGEPLSPQAKAQWPQAMALMHQWLTDALNQLAPAVTGRQHA